MKGQNELLRDVRSILNSAEKNGNPDEITLRHALNEGWFSDALAWLLDPRGDHALGVRFLQEFLKEVAKERCREGARLRPVGEPSAMVDDAGQRPAFDHSPARQRRQLSRVLFILGGKAIKARRQVL